MLARDVTYTTHRVADGKYRNLPSPKGFLLHNVSSLDILPHEHTTITTIVYQEKYNTANTHTHTLSMNFLDADVPDPTDFPPQAEAPGLRTLDGSFRCDICGELYDAPVTIICGHCFCSVVRISYVSSIRDSQFKLI